MSTSIPARHPEAIPLEHQIDASEARIRRAHIGRFPSGNLTGTPSWARAVVDPLDESEK